MSHFNLDSADRIEVLRGPFSALYGNASGGVVQIFTADGRDPPELRVGVTGGSFGALRTSLNARGKQDDFDYTIDYSYFRSDGYREHSAAQRHSLNVKLALSLSNGATLTLIGNDLEQPDTQDPLGITRAQFDANPRQTAAVAAQYNTRKRVAQAQGGAIYEQAIGDSNSVRALLYGGSRDIVQFLSIPAATQGAPTQAGGVVDLATGYGGTDLRWTHRAQWAGQPLELSAGIYSDTTPVAGLLFRATSALTCTRRLAARSRHRPSPRPATAPTAVPGWRSTCAR
ncbi:MAG: hypothetical protein ACREO8_10060 [Luteimonas sp.]